MLASQMAGNSGVGVLALSKQEVLEYPEDGLSWTGALSWCNVVLPVTPPLTTSRRLNVDGKRMRNKKKKKR